MHGLNQPAIAARAGLASLAALPKARRLRGRLAYADGRLQTRRYAAPTATAAPPPRS